MTSDTATGEAQSDNRSNVEKLDGVMTPQNELNKDDDKDDSQSENTDDVVQRLKFPENSSCEGSPPEFVVSAPIHFEVSQDDEDVIAENNSKASIIDIDNIQILDDLPDKDTSTRSNSDTVNISDSSSSDKSTDDGNISKDSNAKNIVADDITINDEEGSCATGANLKSANVVVFNPKNNVVDKQILSNDLLKGQRVFILNGNVISKEEAEKTKTDNINIICVSNNLNDIIKNITNDTIKPGRTLISPEPADKNTAVLNNIEKLITNHQSNVAVKNISPKFIQITQSNYKQISPKIHVTTPKSIAPKPAASTNKQFDILRTKLQDTSEVPSPNQISETPVTVKNRASVGILKKDDEPESSAVAKARNEFIRCRKQLIEAAIHPQLPTYKPPTNYEGPTFSCEECDDTFSCMDSLKNHKNRRSVLFTYACPLCKCTLEFYNRCTFLLHVRSHDAAVKACYLTISTIPSDKLNFKLLLQDEIEMPVLQPEKPMIRSKDRTIRKDDEENDDSSNKTEIKENGIEKSTNIGKAIDKSLLKNFDFIKSLRRSKFTSYLKNTERNKKFLEKNALTKKSDSETSLSDDSSSDENDVSSSKNISADDIAALNGATNASQLKYFLTVNDLGGKSNLKRPLENDKQNANDSNKKVKIIETKTNDVENASSSLKPKPKPQPSPVIIKSKPTTPPPKPETVTDKPTDEITLTSSDDEDDVEGGKNSDDNMVACRDCRQEVNNLNKHYRGDNKPLKEYLCEQCKFFNPSACALQAHNRMHTKAQPYICPDCGFYFCTLETFQTHVRQVCYYDYKAIRFQCPECSLLKPSVPQFSDHLKRCHTRDVFKCSLCITSSYSPKVVDIHIRRKHEKENGTVLEGYRCMLCPNILVSKKSIDTHINKHVFSLKHLRYVYICKRCKKYASGKISKFIHHLSTCPEKKKENVVKTSKDKVSPSKPSPGKVQRQNKANRSRPSKSPGKREGKLGEKDPLSIEEWEADKLKAQYVPKTKICVMCRSADISSKSNSLFCQACVCSVNADDNCTEPSDNSETRRDSGRPKRKFKCRLCKQFMNKDWATITRHYEQDHHSDFKVKGEAKPRQSKDLESKKTSESVSSVNIIKKRRLSTKETSSKSPKLEEKPVDVSAAYKCAKCKTTSNDREEFHVHIKSHKDADHLQCLECGECFIVAASLAKHLVIAHNICNLRAYFIENGLMKEEKESTEKEKTLVENQCEVCFLKCDTKQKYDKHIRTHGMAFVALQSRSKDEKSPRG